MAMLPRTADVVIVGGGVHGASLAYHLARKRAGQVVLLERAHLASGPTARSTALVRRFYGLDFFTRTASAAADVFQRWGDLIGGDPGFRQVGFLVLAGPEEAVPLERNVQRARRIGARVELLQARASDRSALGRSDPHWIVRRVRSPTGPVERLSRR